MKYEFSLTFNPSNADTTKFVMPTSPFYIRDGAKYNQKVKVCFESMTADGEISDTEGIVYITFNGINGNQFRKRNILNTGGTEIAESDFVPIPLSLIIPSIRTQSNRLEAHIMKSDGVAQPNTSYNVGSGAGGTEPIAIYDFKDKTYFGAGNINMNGNQYIIADAPWGREVNISLSRIVGGGRTTANNFKPLTTADCEISVLMTFEMWEEYPNKSETYGINIGL